MHVQVSPLDLDSPPSPEHLGQHAVLPLVADWVKLAVQLPHVDALGVDDLQEGGQGLGGRDGGGARARVR